MGDRLGTSAEEQLMFVRVVLDTCTVRNRTDNTDPQLDLGLIRQNGDNLRISLSASAFVELTRQIVDGDLPFSDWQAKIPALNDVLDERWPLLPNGRQLAWLAGTQIVEPIKSVEDESRYMRACWHHLLEVRPEEIGKSKVVYRLSDGTLRRIALNEAPLKEVIKDQRQSWIDYIKSMQTELTKRGFISSDEKQILAIMQSNYGTVQLDTPGMSEKLDGVARMIARFIAMSLPPKFKPYNPEGEKQRGDTFDINLLFYVSLPAIIVTGDGRFARGLKETKSPQASRVLTITEFNDHLSKGTLLPLASDHQTAERQRRHQKEAAYFRWRNRGCPLNDDWRDWFWSEPIA
jgi:hypothetical protein